MPLFRYFFNIEECGFTVARDYGFQMKDCYQRAHPGSYPTTKT